MLERTLSLSKTIKLLYSHPWMESYVCFKFLGSPVFIKRPCLRAVRFPPGEQEPSVFENVITAERMKTSRAVVDRLLDASNPSLTISTLGKAARALGRKIKIELVPA